jgi:hypothetical protein
MKTPPSELPRTRWEDRFGDVTLGYLETFDLRDRAETLLAAKERKSVHILKYSPVFVTQAAGNKIKQCRESNVSRCPLFVALTNRPDVPFRRLLRGASINCKPTS